MPLYEYQCDACGHRFEVLQRLSDPRIDKCPKCGSPVHKLMSSPAIQFKGSGFYITDYPKGESGGLPKSSGGKDKEPSSSTESSSEKASSDKGSDQGGEKGSDKSPEKAAEKTSDKKTEKSAGTATATAAPAPAPAAAAKKES